MDTKQEELQNGENTSCCHHKESESQSNGVDNQAFQLSNEKTVAAGGKRKEEIGLEGMSYRTLCGCEEMGKPCSCRTLTLTPPNKLVVRLESWDHWKCVALSVVVTLIVCWIVIFTALLLTNVF